MIRFHNKIISISLLFPIFILDSVFQKRDVGDFKNTCVMSYDIYFYYTFLV